MADHYYSKQPQSQSEPTSFTAKLSGRELVFHTDHGVFSRSGVDTGSRLLIESLPTPLSGKLLDLGCGYGVVGIAAAAASPYLQVWMVDVNERAVQLATKNALVNKVNERVQVLQGDGVTPLPESLQFDWIALNPPIRAGKDVVFGLYQEGLSRMSPVGTLFIVIQKKQGAESSEKFLRSLGFEVGIVVKNKGYRVYACKNSQITH